MMRRIIKFCDSNNLSWIHDRFDELSHKMTLYATATGQSCPATRIICHCQYRHIVFVAQYQQIHLIFSVKIYRLEMPPIGRIASISSARCSGRCFAQHSSSARCSGQCYFQATRYSLVLSGGEALIPSTVTTGTTVTTGLLSSYQYEKLTHQSRSPMYPMALCFEAYYLLNNLKPVFFRSVD